MVLKVVPIVMQLVGDMIDLSSLSDDYIGSQYDNFKTQLNFMRPDGYETQSLVLVFQSAFYGTNYVEIGLSNEYLLPNTVTQAASFGLRVKFKDGPSFTEGSDMIQLRLRPGSSDGTPIQPWPDPFGDLLDKAVVHQVYDDPNNVLKSYNLAGTLVESVPVDATSKLYVDSNDDRILTTAKTFAQNVPVLVDGSTITGNGTTIPLKAVGGGGGGATVQEPYILTAEENGMSNVFVLPKTPDVVFDVLINEGTDAFYYLRVSNYTVNKTAKTVTINAPALTAIMEIKINYTSREA